MLTPEQIKKLQELGFQKIITNCGVLYRYDYGTTYLGRPVKFDIWEDGLQVHDYCQDLPKQKEHRQELAKVGIK